MCCISFMYSSNLSCRSRHAAAGQCAGHACLLNEVFACHTVLCSKASPGLACGQTYLYIFSVNVTNSPQTTSDSELGCSTSSRELMSLQEALPQVCWACCCSVITFCTQLTTHLQQALESSVLGVADTLEKRQRVCGVELGMPQSSGRCVTVSPPAV